MSSQVLPQEREAAELTNGPGEQDRGSPRSRIIARLLANSSTVAIAIAGALYCGLSLRIFLASLSLTKMLTYPLDDVYIGMAIAKSFAAHGIWGVTPAHFSSASSCPGFLLVLSALYRLTGATDWWPLVLSFCFGILSIIMASRVLKGAGPINHLIALCALVFFTPLHVMGLLGMEHSLHIALTLAFLNGVGRSLASEQCPSWGLLILASFMTSVRYESLFVIAAASFLYLLDRKARAAVYLVIAAAIPVLVYGAISVTLHSNWLPNSISLKGLSGGAAVHFPLGIVEHFNFSIARAPYLGLLLATIVVLTTIPGVRADKRAFSMLVIVFASTVFHLALADIGWVYRYEAYLVAAAIVAIAFAVPYVEVSRSQLKTKALLSWAVTATLLIFGAIGTYFLSRRTLEAGFTLPHRSMAVYSQQIQMARFLRHFEQGTTVAANDIGAINYYADINCVDLVGLADDEVFRLKRNNAYSTASLSKLAGARQVRIALVYDSWFSIAPPIGLRGLGGPPLPASWIRVARWRTPYAQYSGSDQVSFYATDPAAAERLQDSLARFAPSLPPQVEVFWR